MRVGEVLPRYDNEKETMYMKHMDEFMKHVEETITTSLQESVEEIFEKKEVKTGLEG